MQAVIQRRAINTPSIRLALMALSLAAVIVVLSLQLDASRLPANASTAVAAGSVTKNGQVWPSDIMDSHESVQSLAALAKSKDAKAKPLLKPSVPSESELALLGSPLLDQSR